MTERRLFHAAGAALFLYWAVSWIWHAAQHGSYATLIAEVITVIGIAWSMLAGRVLQRIPAGQRWRVETGEGATIVRPNRLRSTVVMFGVIALLLGPILMGALQLMGRLDVPIGDPPTIWERLLSGFFPVAGVVCGFFAVVWLAGLVWRRGDVGSLIMNPRGVGLSTRRSAAVSWDAVRDVPPVGSATSRSGVYLGPELRIEASPTPLKLPLSRFPTDAQPLANMVRFYWHNPHCRDELGTARAVARWEAGDFPGVAGWNSGEPSRRQNGRGSNSE
jgi:hypothetical protein